MHPHSTDLPCALGVTSAMAALTRPIHASQPCGVPFSHHCGLHSPNSLCCIVSLPLCVLQLKSFHNELLTELEKKVELDARYLNVRFSSFCTVKTDTPVSLLTTQLTLF